MTKCLSCGHIRSDVELNCSKCGSFYSKISVDFLPNDDAKKMDTTNLKTEKSNPNKTGEVSLMQRFLQLFR